jgi:hypothetical protein
VKEAFYELAFEGIKILAAHFQKNRRKETCTRHFRQQKPCQPVSQKLPPSMMPQQ